MPDRDDIFGCARKCSAWTWRACRNRDTDTWAPCRTRGADAASCSSSGWNRGCSADSSDSCSRSTLCAVSWRRSGEYLKNSKSQVSGRARLTLILAHERAWIRVVESCVGRIMINITRRTRSRVLWGFLQDGCISSFGMRTINANLWANSRTVDEEWERLMCQFMTAKEQRDAKILANANHRKQHGLFSFLDNVIYSQQTYAAEDKSPVKSPWLKNHIDEAIRFISHKIRSSNYNRALIIHTKYTATNTRVNDLSIGLHLYYT